jgi:23S rRNA pseudouridine1911/1915/1917 synthase
MLNEGYIYVDRIHGNDQEGTALAYYLRHYAHSSREVWLSHFENGNILLNGEIAAPDAKLKLSDALEYHRPPWEEEEVPTDIPLLAQGDGWLVFAKPSGIPVLPGGGFLQNTMLHILRARWGRTLAPVHRLGRGTSGAILFSSSAEAAATLGAAMRERRVEKTYLALVQGLPAADDFSVETAIGKVPHDLLGSVFAAASGGKPSLSHCRVLRRDARRDESLMEVRIPTGRPHQIRIHCAWAGHPLIGDPLYGPDGLPMPVGEGRAAVPGDCGYYLHSWKIAFPLPGGNGRREIIADPPAILDPDGRSLP